MLTNTDTRYLAFLRQNLEDCLNDFIKTGTPTFDSLCDFFKRWYANVKSDTIISYDISLLEYTLIFTVEVKCGSRTTSIKTKAYYQKEDENVVENL